MKVVISTGRQAHYRLPANAFVRRGCDVNLYTTTPRSRMRGFAAAVQNRWIPAPVTIVSALAHCRTPLILDEMDSTLFDRWAAAALGHCDLLVGASTSSLATGRSTQKMGGTFILDRACPDIRVQQQMLAEEAHKAGGMFRRNSSWFVERQVEEYELANYILMPSDYSRRSYPEHLRQKSILAPLYGTYDVAACTPRRRNCSTFVLGTVGGGPLRKGFLYLLQAWKELALSNARLKIRTSSEVYSYPVLKQLLNSQSNVQVVSYVPDINSFYDECDAFILPSVDDGFGLALIEAMARGLPAIATRNCGASERLVPDRDFLLIDAFSVEQMKEAILRLYDSPELCEQLQRNAPKAVAALSKERQTTLYEDAIDLLLEAVSRKVH